MEYKYQWELFNDHLALTRFLNREEILKENILKIEYNGHNVELIYIKVK